MAVHDGRTPSAGSAIADHRTGCDAGHSASRRAAALTLPVLLADPALRDFEWRPSVVLVAAAGVFFAACITVWTVVGWFQRRRRATVSARRQAQIRDAVNRSAAFAAGWDDSPTGAVANPLQIPRQYR